MFIRKIFNILSKDGRKHIVPCEHMNATFADKTRKKSAVQKEEYTWDLNKSVAFCRTTRAGKNFHLSFYTVLATLNKRSYMTQNQHTFQQRKWANIFHVLFRAVLFLCGGSEQTPVSNDRVVVCCFKRCCVENGICCGGRELGGEELRKETLTILARRQ